MAVRYRRILLKLSGEALMGDDPFGINRQTIERIVDEVAQVAQLGVEIGVVIGGGNIFRGVALGAAGMDRATADYMGMLATIMNALALADVLRQKGINARVQSAINVEQVVEPYIRPKAIRYLEEGKVVVFAAGTGNPFFTTDTAAALRGSEIGAEIVLKATKVDGVYTADPMQDPGAKRFERITFDEAIQRNLKVMDATAFALLRDNKLPILVFSILRPGALRRIVQTAEQKMVKTIEALKHDLAKVRTGRAHTGLLDHVMVDYYGTPTPVPQVANVTLLDARPLGVQPWEKTRLAAVEKAIRDADLGLNPATQGDVVRVPMPALTEERRRELIKVVKHEGENARVAVRNLRRDANHHLKELLKAREVSEDAERKAQDEVQKLTDKYVAEIDKILQHKEADLLAV